MTECPDCGSNFRGKKCTCGYDPASIPVHKPCGMPNCQMQAVIMLKKGNARLNVCKVHYNRLFQEHAHKWCMERGLDTREKMIAFCKKTARGFGVKV